MGSVLNKKQNEKSILMCGQPYSGKSTLAYKLSIYPNEIQASTRDEYQLPNSTEGLENYNINFEKKKIRIWDIGGSESVIPQFWPIFN